MSDRELLTKCGHTRHHVKKMGWRFRLRCPNCHSDRYETVGEHADYWNGTGVTYTHQCRNCKGHFTSFRDWLDFH